MKKILFLAYIEIGDESMAKFSQFNQSRSEKEAKGVSEDDVRKTFNAYKDMSQDQLNQTLLQEVARQKQSGTFDYKGLESMVNSLRGMLPEQDYQNIKRLLESIK